MLSNYDLYDISATFMRLRKDIQCEANVAIIEAILPKIQFDKQYNDDNQIRQAIASVQGLDRDLWYFVYYNNVYVHRRILKDEYIYTILLVVCERIHKLLICKQFNQAYDIVDAVHCLPDIIAENNFSVTKSYWMHHLKQYRHKWDNKFLVNEQKLYIKTH